MQETRQRTLAELAQEAKDVQDACNLSGVAGGFFRALCDLRSHVGGGDALRTHPITFLWMDKLKDMTGRVEDIAAYSKAYDAVEAILSEANTPIADVRRA